ncbi:MAG: tRNA lysidine(34) synthetase TilS, partial [Flavobacterium sp.]|nr:tRNA lysidine(34) synthetase TilS [Flavobacterium sp.]
VPLLQEINPNFMEAFQKTQSYLQESAALVEDASIMVYQQVAKQEEDSITFDLNQLKKLPNYNAYLYQWLSEFGFTAWNDVYDLVDAVSGKKIFASNFRLLKNRDSLILSKILVEDEVGPYFITKEQQEISIPLKLTFISVANPAFESNKIIFVDGDKLQYPLELKRWQKGDNFQPFGMGGKSKKLSKFFKDEKLSLLEKEQCWLLWSANTLVWITGLRQDERFKITENTTNILKIELE